MGERPKLPTRPLRGMRDILPPESEEISYIEHVFRRVAKLFGYGEVIPPTIERFELFAMKSGEEIVKSMYSFRDKAGRHIALRPEVTASIARIYIDKLKAQPKPVRLFYLVNCFRYEEPQLGRYREFRQGGLELLGLKSVEADAEPVIVLGEFYSKLGLEDYVVVAGNIGLYHTLYDKFKVEDNAARESLRLMDKGMVEDGVKVACENSKDPKGLRGLLEILSNFKGEVEEVKNVLKDLRRELFPELVLKLEDLVVFGEIISSAQIPIYIDATLARGLEYYTGVIYEVKVKGLNVSIGGGGRYDELVETFGGPPTPATGNAIGIERTLLALKSLRGEVLEVKPLKVAVLPLDREAVKYAFNVQKKLHALNVEAVMLLQRRSMGRMLSELSKKGYTHAVILGLREESSREVTVKNLKSKHQKTLGFDELSLELLEEI